MLQLFPYLSPVAGCLSQSFQRPQSLRLRWSSFEFWWYVSACFSTVNYFDSCSRVRQFSHLFRCHHLIFQILQSELSKKLSLKNAKHIFGFRPNWSSNGNFFRKGCLTVRMSSMICSNADWISVKLGSSCMVPNFLSIVWIDLSTNPQPRWSPTSLFYFIFLSIFLSVYFWNLNFGPYVLTLVFCVFGYIPLKFKCFSLPRNGEIVLVINADGFLNNLLSPQEYLTLPLIV